MTRWFSCMWVEDGQEGVPEPADGEEREEGGDHHGQGRQRGTRHPAPAESSHRLDHDEGAQGGGQRLHKYGSGERRPGPLRPPAHQGNHRAHREQDAGGIGLAPVGRVEDEGRVERHQGETQVGERRGDPQRLAVDQAGQKQVRGHEGQADQEVEDTVVVEGCRGNRVDALADAPEQVGKKRWVVDGRFEIRRVHGHGGVPVSGGETLARERPRPDAVVEEVAHGVRQG